MRNIFAASVLVSSLALVACGGESSTAPAAASPAAPVASAAPAAPAPAANPEPAVAAAPAAAPAPVAAPAPAPEPAKPVVVAAGDAKVGDTTKCLVTGDEFVVKADSPKVELKGKTYYFHDEKSAKEFKANTKKYLKAEPKADAKTDAKATDKKPTDAKPADKAAK